MSPALIDRGDSFSAESISDTMSCRTKNSLPRSGTGVTSVTCYTAAFGTPVRKTDAIAFGAVRYSGDVVGVPLGVELKVAYEPSEDRWGVALPVYFIKNKDGKLNGGAKIGWQSDKDDFSFGFFIGAAFDFLNM